jgi:hypothetical protein
MTRHVTLGALALAGLTMIAACGSAGAKGAAQVASVAGDNTTTTTVADESTSEADAQQAMLDFAACMREHGIDMPDPQFSSDGGGTFTAGVEGSDTAIDKAKMDAAQEACQSFLDKVKSNSKPMDPARLEEEKQKLLAFAQCMRDHGIDFPDPEISSDGGGLSVQMGGPGMDTSSPGFKDASEACSTEVGLPGFGTTPAGGDGNGPSIAVQSGDET